MKTIGLLGGMSWQSSLTYYQNINKIIQQRLGKLHSAKIIMISVDFQEIESLQRNNDWDKAAILLTKEAKNIQDAGADFLVLCTNTMHKIASTIEEQLNIPFLHIADVLGIELQKKNITQIGLLGTAFTMQEDFYKKRLRDKFSIEVFIPENEDIKIIHNIIFNELCLGIITENSKNEYLRIINSLAEYGSQAVILGCTEIGLLITQKDSTIPIFDTTQIHILSAVNAALSSKIHQ